ncbi:MAG: ABC transporter ATP-binding protein [Deltaproteobacteria bacterium]|nr:ABC transporter ATP-binding protein [Deltaproteobacteria bacterium]
MEVAAEHAIAGNRPAPAAPLPLRLRGVCKRFGPREALRGIDLDVPAGTAIGLVGPNGAGKTTLMRLIVGLERPTSGSVELFGKTPRAADLSHVGYMTQAEAVYADLSVRDNVRFFGRLYGLRGDALDDAVRRAIALVDLADRAGDRVDTLSGGMRRRTSLACAVLHAPRLLLLDEPTVGVDPELRAAFWDHFVEMRKAGAALLITTHHLDEARRCDRLVLLRDGAAIAEGTTAELLERAGCDSIEDAFLWFARRRTS